MLSKASEKWNNFKKEENHRGSDGLNFSLKNRQTPPGNILLTVSNSEDLLNCRVEHIVPRKLEFMSIAVLLTVAM